MVAIQRILDVASAHQAINLYILRSLCQEESEDVCLDFLTSTLPFSLADVYEFSTEKLQGLINSPCFRWSVETNYIII